MSRLLQELSIEPQCLMALGDGENDVEMLQVSLANSLGMGGFHLCLWCTVLLALLNRTALSTPELIVDNGERASGSGGA